MQQYICIHTVKPIRNLLKKCYVCLTSETKTKQDGNTVQRIYDNDCNKIIFYDLMKAEMQRWI